MIALLQKRKGTKSGSGRSKRLLHLEDRCMRCGTCEAVCSENAIIVNETFVEFLTESCSGCGRCVKKCPTEALRIVETGEAN